MVPPITRDAVINVPSRSAHEGRRIPVVRDRVEGCIVKTKFTTGPFLRQHGVMLIHVAPGYERLSGQRSSHHPFRTVPPWTEVLGGDIRRVPLDGISIFLDL